MINVLDILDAIDQYDREQEMVLEEISVDSDAVDRLNSIADFLDDQHQG
jgi:hypothetical protein